MNWHVVDTIYRMGCSISPLLQIMVPTLLPAILISILVLPGLATNFHSNSTNILLLTNGWNFSHTEGWYLVALIVEVFQDVSIKCVRKSPHILFFIFMIIEVIFLCISKFSILFSVFADLVMSHDLQQSTCTTSAMTIRHVFFSGKT